MKKLLWLGFEFWIALTIVLSVPGWTKAHEPNYEIVINIPGFSLHLYEDGTLKKTYPIGVGATVNPSRLGATEVINNVSFPTYYPPDWYMKGLRPIPPGPDNPVGTRWIGLGFPGYGIHGTNNNASIGTAASAGCIRMFNDDVEELAGFVKVGTSVRFIYETIEAWQDPVTQSAQIRVYKDIYNQGTNGIEQSLKVLARAGIDTTKVDRPALQDILAEAAGIPRSVPVTVPLYFHGEVLGVSAIRYGGHLLLPLERLAQVTKDSVEIHSGEDNDVIISGRPFSGVFWLGKSPYFPVDKMTHALGLLALSADFDGVHLVDVQVVSEEGEDLPLRAYVMDSWLLLPVEPLSQRLGVSIRWDRGREVLRVGGSIVFGVYVIDGKPYLPHDRLGHHLPVQVHWSPSQTRAVLVGSSAKLPRPLKAAVR